MRETFESRVDNCKTLLDVLLLLKDVTMLDTHVATLAYVETIQQEYIEENKYGIIKCKPFPLEKDQEEYSIFAYYFKESSEFNEGDIITILFTDFNFINNLKVIDKKPRVTMDTGLHSLKYGIIINTM